jgi:hypothetical protein
VLKKFDAAKTETRDIAKYFVPASAILEFVAGSTLKDQ